MKRLIAAKKRYFLFCKIVQLKKIKEKEKQNQIA